MARASEIIALRSLGLSLGAIRSVLKGETDDLEPALAAHQAVIEEKIRDLAGTADRVRALRTNLAKGETPNADELAHLARTDGEWAVFDLPWPWGGERFELRNISPLTYITGPLGSGKTRLARAIAEHLPNATFLGLDRLAAAGKSFIEGLEANATHKARIDRALAWLIDDGATASPALIALLAAFEAKDRGVLVVDMVEQGLDRASQEALMAYLRHHRSPDPPLFLMTRSRSILDLSAIGPGEAIVFCPANHSPPHR